MVNGFEQLCDWLHKCRPEGTTPQWGGADETKKGLWWLPGNCRRASGCTVPLDRVRFLGTTNRSYRHPLEEQHGQESWITWCGLDIDHDDQRDSLKGDGKLAKAVVDAIWEGDEPMGSVRSSCGGRGVHVFFRLAVPVPVPANPTTGLHSAITRAILRPIVERVGMSGIHICKSDSRMFWVWGGKNDWIVQTDRMLDVDPMLLGRVTRPSDPERAQMRTSGATPDWVEHDPFVRDWLTRLGAKPGLCYIGDVVNALRRLGERVETRSAMSGNKQPNGYVDIAPGQISVWAYADGRTIWCAEDVERTVTAMMGGDK